MEFNYQAMPVSSPKGTSEIGSLLRLFQSEYFTMAMLIFYLRKHFDNKGVHDYLVNRLYSFPDKEIEFYLPQLCYILIKRESKDLQKFLLQKCSESFISYLKISLNLNAFGASKNKKQTERIAKLENYCEIAVVNGDDKDLMAYPLVAANLPEFQEKISLKFHEKEVKSNYHNHLLRFLNKLITMSLQLKNFKESEQPKKLKEFLQVTNLWLRSNKQQMKEEAKGWIVLPRSISLFEGIILPFGNLDEEFLSNLVVRIIEEDFKIFITRKRVPYRILVETIDAKELDTESFRLHIKKSQSTADNLSDGSNASNSNLSFSLNKPRSPLRKKELSPRLLNEWEKIGDSVEEFDIFQCESLDELALSELRKYEGLNSFAKTVEKSEKKERPSFFLKKPSIKPKLNPTPEEDLIALKTENFEEMYPSKSVLRSRSNELEPENKKIVRHLSETTLPIIENIDFIDKMLKNAKMTQTQESKLKSVMYKISSQADVKKEVKRFGPWGEIWEDWEQAIRQNSPYGHLASYRVRPIIVKGGDDLRQEVIAMQFIRKLKQIFKENKINVFLRPYEVIVTSANSGIIEFIPNTMSLDHLKKHYLEKKHNTNLYDIYLDVFGIDFEEKQKNFVESLAAYSLVCYLLNVKDRHNGNILIDNQGHIIHIDFGFMFSFTPGGINFEKAPFKLTEEYVDLMGGTNSDMFRYFKVLLLRMLILLKKHVEELTSLICVMMEDSNLPCFSGFDFAAFQAKFGETKTEDEKTRLLVDKLIDQSLNNWRTIKYDDFQKMSNGILP